ncbi:MAG: PAS domain-containing protein [Hyphomicrobiaceae bacterium]
MKQPTIRLLYNYWNDVRGERLAPTRFEIEPSRISRVLSETFILERTSDGAHTFRLAGTRICEQLGTELRGRDATWLAGPDRDILEAMLEKITRDGGVGLFEFEATTKDRRRARFETVILPLVHPDDQITRYVGAMSAIEPPAWLGVDPLSPASILTHEVIWPDGRPHAVVAHSRQQLAFSPAFAQARVVRFDRRQFRILDGGRKE